MKWRIFKMNKTPIYKHSGAYAQEHDQLKRYIASCNAHVACKEAIEQAIDDHFNNNCLSSDAAKSVIEQFGADRTMYVLATTIRASIQDGRYDPDNKAWAEAFPLVDDVDRLGRDRTRDLAVYRSHPGLINLFTHMVRDEAEISSPLYKQTFDYAKGAGETAEYRTSCRINSLCQREIDDAVQAGWDGMNIAPEAVKPVLERFGPERVSYVLANTIQQRKGDERFSRDNRAWAKTVPMFVPLERRAYCVAASHSVKLDDFITVVRQTILQMDKEREQSAKARRPSVRKKLQEQSVAPDAPKPPAKARGKHPER